MAAEPPFHRDPHNAQFSYSLLQIPMLISRAGILRDCMYAEKVSFQLKGLVSAHG